MAQWNRTPKKGEDFYCSACGTMSSFRECPYHLIFNKDPHFEFFFCERCWKDLVSQILAQSGDEPADRFK